MESSIAAFLMRWLACELLPTSTHQGSACATMPLCFLLKLQAATLSPDHVKKITNRSARIANAQNASASEPRSLTETASQHSFHNAPISDLSRNVAVHGTHRRDLVKVLTDRSDRLPAWVEKRG